MPVRWLNSRNHLSPWSRLTPAVPHLTGLTSRETTCQLSKSKKRHTAWTQMFRHGGWSCCLRARRICRTVSPWVLRGRNPGKKVLPYLHTLLPAAPQAIKSQPKKTREGASERSSYHVNSPSSSQLASHDVGSVKSGADGVKRLQFSHQQVHTSVTAVCDILIPILTALCFLTACKGRVIISGSMPCSTKCCTSIQQNKTPCFTV